MLYEVITAIRSAVHSAKCLKDSRLDLESFREAVDDRFNAWFGRFRDSIEAFYGHLAALNSATSPMHRFEMLSYNFV